MQCTKTSLIVALSLMSMGCGNEPGPVKDMAQPNPSSGVSVALRDESPVKPDTPTLTPDCEEPGVPGKEDQDFRVKLDPMVLRLLTSKDASLIKVLHDRSENELLSNLGITTDKHGIATGRHQKKVLVFHRKYELGHQPRHVFVYDPTLHSWPGTQPQTIVICDAMYQPLDWKEVGGSPMFERAELDSSSGTGPVLLITRTHRHTFPNPKRGIYRFSLNNDMIRVLPGTEWLYKDDSERAQYARWRDTLRKRSMNSP